MHSKLGWSQEDHDKESAIEVERDYDVTVRRSGCFYEVTANSDNARLLLGKGTFTYEESEWKKLNKELRNYTYTIEVR